MSKHPSSLDLALDAFRNSTEFKNMVARARAYGESSAVIENAFTVGWSTALLVMARSSHPAFNDRHEDPVLALNSALDPLPVEGTKGNIEVPEEMLKLTEQEDGTITKGPATQESESIPEEQLRAPIGQSTRKRGK